MYLHRTHSILVLDAETGSKVDITKQGQYIYWEDPSTRVFMLSAKWLGAPDSETYLWDFEAQPADILPAWFHKAAAASSSEVIFAAANCEFDRAALNRLGIPTPSEKWLDILVLAYSLGFAGRVKDVLTQSEMGEGKMDAGTRCINTFSKLYAEHQSWRDDPAMWDQFRAYCVQDTRAEEHLLRRWLPWLQAPENAASLDMILRQELIYREINRTGIPVDVPGVKGACVIREHAKAQLLEDMNRITGLENTGSDAQFKRWLGEMGRPTPNVQKATLRDLLAELQDPFRETNPEGEAADDDITKVIQWRQEYKKTSTDKFPTLLAHTSEDNRFRGGWQFYGASRTGRVAGRILNPANLARPSIKDPDLAIHVASYQDPQFFQLAFPEQPALMTLSSCLRAALKAPPGQKWCVADLSSIESVGAAWLAGCQSVLDIFHDGRDTYKTFAANAEGIPYEDVTKVQRDHYKPAVLGGAYQLSGPGLVRYAEAMGVELSLKEGFRQIDSLREQWFEIVHYWAQLTKAAQDAIRRPGHVFQVKAVDHVDRNGFYVYRDWPIVSYYTDGTFLVCTLPSGRRLFYYRPSLEPAEITYINREGESVTSTIREAVHYYGRDQVTNAWTKINVHGGKQLENITQAVCRDILWHGLEQAAADPGLDLIGDVYDEILALCAEEDVGALDRLIGYMTSHPAWMDDRFYLGADGYISDRYRKD